MQAASLHFAWLLVFPIDFLLVSVGFPLVSSQFFGASLVSVGFCWSLGFCVFIFLPPDRLGVTRSPAVRCPSLPFFGWEASPKIDAVKQPLVPTSSNLSNLEDLVGVSFPGPLISSLVLWRLAGFKPVCDHRSLLQSHPGWTVQTPFPVELRAEDSGGPGGAARGARGARGAAVGAQGEATGAGGFRADGVFRAGRQRRFLSGLVCWPCSIQMWWVSFLVLQSLKSSDVPVS